MSKPRLFTGADYYANQDLFNSRVETSSGIGPIDCQCRVTDYDKPIGVEKAGANGDIEDDCGAYFLNKWPESAREWADIYISLYDIFGSNVKGGREGDLELDDIEYWAKKTTNYVRFILWDEDENEFKENTFSACYDFYDKELNEEVRELIVKDLKEGNHLKLSNLHEIKIEDIWAAA